MAKSGYLTGHNRLVVQASVQIRFQILQEVHLSCEKVLSLGKNDKE